MFEYALLLGFTVDGVREADGQIHHERKQAWYASGVAVVVLQEPFLRRLALLLGLARVPCEHLSGWKLTALGPTTEKISWNKSFSTHCVPRAMRGTIQNVLFFFIARSFFPNGSTNRLGNTGCLCSRTGPRNRSGNAAAPMVVPGWFDESQREISSYVGVRLVHRS